MSKYSVILLTKVKFEVKFNIYYMNGFKNCFFSKWVDLTNKKSGASLLLLILRSSNIIYKKRNDRTYPLYQCKKIYFTTTSSAKTRFITR